ncbi:mitogen-activated protein kinase-binding protein 1-like isoform X1 [Megalobrama amblycephala]|uniref:mitogen-activated protein kinase-binding protein 1-like isoform X1 n=1 Tax=Megalobrama amblycephala TaxID=75352 RepID=UPI0020143865|nr:mitogen-activated protein kinase-binding protein 1-like isoform X1 [Megalobrama amblycephala]
MEAFTIKSRIKSLLRSPSIRLRKSRSRFTDSLSRKVTLEKVLGITTAGNSGLSCDPCSGTIAYPAGCVVVLLNPAKNTQQHLINSSRKTISTLSFSSDGRFLVTGESGHLPAVRVWDVSEGTQVCELLEHQYGVSCVAFSPNSKYIVSVGSQHDMSVNVWAWKKNALVAANKVSSKVTAVSFSEDSAHFVTAGNRHVRFWYLEPSRSHEPVPLMGRSGLLGELQNNFFCGVACGRGPKSDSTFCITSSGLLCEFSGRRVLERWVRLQTSSAHALTVTEDLIFCACADGTVRVFSPSDLRFICTLPRPHHLGVDVSTVTQASHLFSRKPDARYPDTVAVTFDPVNRWLSCVYNDHSLYVWDARDLQKVGKVHSALYHSACVWDLQMFPTDADGSQTALGSSDLFLSCSSDSTVRFWSSDGVRRANVLSSDLHHVLYMDDNTAALLDVEGTAVSGSEKPESSSADSRSGIRSICVSPDGRHLASGDRNGTLRIHDLTCMKEMVKAEAHDSEILCLEYSKPDTGMNLLATASRDRLIHVLEVEEDYGLLQTLDEHSSSVTSVRFAASDGKLRIISCGADKSVYIRTAHRTIRGTAFKRTHHVVRKTTPNDMDVDPTCKYAAVGCQDRSVRVINISSGKQKRSYKGSQTEDGSLLKVQMDPSGLYLATSCSDKNISLFDFRTGECLAAVFGHSEIITALRFSRDCRRLVSASGDSCVFVWRLAPELTVSMRERLSERRRRHSRPNARNNPFRRSSSSGFTLRRSPSIMSCSSESDREEDDDDDDEEPMKMPGDTERRPDSSQSEGSVEETTGASDEGHEWNPIKMCLQDSSVSGACRPRRRWSRRMGSLELMVKSMLELRQLDSLSEDGVKNRSSADRLRDEDRGSTSSLQERRHRRTARPLSAWLLPACAPEPDGVVLYPDHCPSASSLPGPSYRVRIPARAEEAQSPVSGASVGYGSGGSSPDHRRHGSDDDRCERDTDTRRDSETLADALHLFSGTVCSISTCFQTSDSSSRTGRGILQKAGGVRPLMEDTVSRRSHPYISRTPARLHRSTSALDPTADARRSLPPSRLRREARPVLPKLSLERMEPRTPPSSPRPWDSPNARYMSPTTSSRAKISRCVSVGDGLHLGSGETLPVSGLFTSAPAEPKHLRPHARQRFSSPFDEWPSRSGSPRDPGSSGAVTSDTERPRAAVKAFSVTSDDQVTEPAVSLESCRRAAADLCRSVRRAAGLYRTLMSHDSERSGERQQMQQLMSDALLQVRSELDSVPGPSGEGKPALALLEQYSRLLLRSVEERLQTL